MPKLKFKKDKNVIKTTTFTQKTNFNFIIYIFIIMNKYVSNSTAGLGGVKIVNHLEVSVGEWVDKLVQTLALLVKHAQIISS